jgi:hypothetical protein
LLFTALSALLRFMNRASIAQLISGTESKIGRKSEPPPNAA